MWRQGWHVSICDNYKEVFPSLQPRGSWLFHQLVPPGQAAVVQGLQAGVLCLSLAWGQPVAGGFHPAATLPWPRSCISAGEQPGNGPGLWTVHPRSFVPGLCVIYQNFLNIKSQGAYISSEFDLFEQFSLSRVSLS